MTDKEVESAKNLRQKFYSSTTVPSTNDSDKYSCNLSVKQVNKLHRPSLPKRKIIFKHKRKKQNKKDYPDLISDEQALNEVLQAKINYFFKPYSEGVNIERDPPMSFKEEQGQAPSDSKNEFSYSDSAKFNWNKVCKTILSKDEQEFRKFLLDINPSMYCRLKQLGQKYYLDEFRKSSKGEKADIETSSSATKDSFDPLVDGMNILKCLILDKISCKAEEKESQKPKEVNTQAQKNECTSAPLPYSGKRQKKVKVKSKVTWADAETLNVNDYTASKTRKFNPDALFNCMMDTWKKDNEQKQQQQSNQHKSCDVDFTKTYNTDFLCPKLTKARRKHRRRNGRKLKVSTTTKDCEFPPVNSEKFLVSMKSKKLSENYEKFSAKSVAESNSKRRIVPMPKITQKKTKGRVKLLTPICLNQSMSSVLSLGGCSDRGN